MRRTHVYVVRGAGLIKIGSAAKVAARISDLQIGSPVPLEIVAHTPLTDAQLEFDIHRRLKDHRHHGEWFRYEGDVIEVVALIQSGNMEALCAFLNPANDRVMPPASPPEVKIRRRRLIVIP
jgi:hypothetical protein